MRKLYLKGALLFFLFACYDAAAQVPYEWPVVESELTSIIDSVNNIILKGNSPGYCTAFAGDLLIANSNRGYHLFTPAPPGAPDVAYENKILGQTDTMLMMMQVLGYKAVDITISYPLLLDSFPNSSVYLDFYKKVYAMARSMGFKIIENCQVTLAADTLVADPYMVQDVRNFYFSPQGTPDTINAQRYLVTMTEMMQTVVDSLKPDYLTLEMEPQTQQVNLFNLISFQAANTLTYVNYFLSHLTNTNGVLLGAGAGTWNDISYFTNYATTAVDYLDYHLYPLQGSTFNPMVFAIDSVAKANNKKLLIGECWDNKISDSEYTAHSDPSYYTQLTGERNVFDYFLQPDTLFVRDMVNLSQQEGIEMINFFNTPVEFGYLTYNSSYDSLSVAQLSAMGTSEEYNNMFNMQLGPLGIYTQSAISKIKCGATGINQIPAKKINQLLIFPNPSTGYLSLETGSPIQYIEIKNVLGQAVMQQESSGSNDYCLISIFSLPAGIYFIRVRTADETMTGKIIKQ